MGLNHKPTRTEALSCEINTQALWLLTGAHTQRKNLINERRSVMKADAPTEGTKGSLNNKIYANQRLLPL